MKLFHIKYNEGKTALLVHYQIHQILQRSPFSCSRMSWLFIKIAF